MSGRHERAIERLQRRRTTILYRVVGRILTIGLWSSISLLAAGLLLTLAHRESLSEELAPFRQIPHDLWSLQPGGFIDLGLLALLLTPVGTVIATLVAAIRQRDWPFVGVGVTLIVIVTLSLVVGLI